MKTPTLAVTAVLALALAGCRVDREPGQADIRDDTTQREAVGTTGEGARVEADTSFAHQAAAGGMTEVELGQLAQEQAANAEVRQFGEQMVQDHSEAKDQLENIAQQKNIQLPEGPEQHQQQMAERLSNLQGMAFDREYMSAMVENHQKSVDLYERQAREGRDEELRGYAERTLPTLREHLQMARDLSAKLQQDDTQ